MATSLPRIPTSLAAATADRYRFERELGQGGMATVYAAQDLKHHRRVAVKVLRAELAATVDGAQFLREIETKTPDSIHRKIKEIAAREGTSVNQFLASAAAEKVSALEAEGYLAERARRGQRARFLELLAKAPAVEPAPFDRLPDEHRHPAPPEGSVVREAVKAPRVGSRSRRSRR